MIPALPEPAVQLPPGEYSVTTTGELVPFYAAAQLEQYARDYHAAQMGWQPIATAPMDGTVILLSCKGRVTAGHREPERYPTASEFHGTTGEYLGSFETGQCIEAWWYSEDGGFTEEHPPSHWMPLPLPPKADLSDLSPLKGIQGVGL